MSNFDSSKVKVNVTQTGQEGDAGMFGKRFTYVQGKIMLDQKEIGTIHATIVNRQAFADNDFHPHFDDESADMEWVGCSLLENRFGRTRLASLVEYDDPEFDFMYISSFGLQDPYMKNSDIATAALHEFLYDPNFIKKDLRYGLWAVSSAVYIVPSVASLQQTSQKRKRQDENDDSGANPSRLYMDPFLRNGFFQDAALIHKDPDNTRLLVASYGQWSKPPLSKEAVANVAVISRPRKPSGNDLEILNSVEELCTTGKREPNFSAIMIGLERYEAPRDESTPQQLQTLRSKIALLVKQGGSLARSTALHMACEHNKPKIVKLILDMDHSTLHTKNSRGETALVVAAKNAAGRITINGLDDTEVVDQLLAAGANKSDTDPLGMTAYGHFTKSADFMLRNPGVDVLQQKLYPPSGPSTGDISGGSGFVDYTAEDAERDAEARADDDDGDY
jgi:hypothetical protein